MGSSNNFFTNKDAIKTIDIFRTIYFSVTTFCIFSYRSEKEYLQTFIDIKLIRLGKKDIV
jgi:hypothetical protein